MANVIINENTLYGIGDAIRAKLSNDVSYKPSQMADAIESIETYPEPTGSVSITENGTANVKDYATAVVNVPNSYDASDEGKVVSEGALVAQTSQSVTQNGTYDTTTNDEVVVNVEGGSALYPGLDAILNGNVQGSIMASKASISLSKFMLSYAVDKQNIASAVSKSLAESSLEDFLAALPDITITSAEYSGYVYGQTSIINDLGLVLLKDASSGASSVTLNQSINNFSCVLLQGVYRGGRNSNYNTSMLYINPQLNTNYWTGMKDRNTSYDCYVKFTSDTTATLSGGSYGHQCLIYGMP